MNILRGMREPTILYLINCFCTKTHNRFMRLEISFAIIFAGPLSLKIDLWQLMMSGQKVMLLTLVDLNVGCCLFRHTCMCNKGILVYHGNDNRQRVLHKMFFILKLVYLAADTIQLPGNELRIEYEANKSLKTWLNELLTNPNTIVKIKYKWHYNW